LLLFKLIHDFDEFFGVCALDGVFGLNVDGPRGFDVDGACGLEEGV